MYLILEKLFMMKYNDSESSKFKQYLIDFDQ